MDKKTIEKLINDACTELYDESKTLIDESANELDIVGYLTPKLREKFAGWDVDTDYNREGQKNERRSKTDIYGKSLKPDVVIHKYGPDGSNLAAIEVKGYWNREPREEDEEKLRRLEAKHHYVFLYRLELGREKFSLIPVQI